MLSVLPSSLLSYWLGYAIFVHFLLKTFVTLLGAIADKWVWTLVCGRNKNINNGHVKVAAQNLIAKRFLACELWVKRVGIFGVVLYRNQWPVNFILHFADLHIGYENTLFGNYFIKCYKAKIILISFNCFSEYIYTYLCFFGSCA